MQRLQTKAIVLRRVDYEEADRIVTVLTPDNGQLSVLAKGVRKQKSKLAGGIELFSLCDITVMVGKGNLYRLMSSRLDEHFDKIITEYERMELAYKVIEHTHRATKDIVEPGVFEILLESLNVLNDTSVPLPIIEIRFYMFMLDIHGQLPNLKKDANGHVLKEGSKYFLDISSGNLQPSENGDIDSDQIKLMRLLAQHDAKKISLVHNASETAQVAVVQVRELFNFVF